MDDIVFWDCDEGAEELRHTSIGRAVEDWADQLDGALPETVTVYGWTRAETGPVIRGMAGPFGLLESLLERLDEDYGGDDPSSPTPAMIEAEKAFLAVIAAEYVPWTCELVERRAVPVADHVPASWMGDSA